MKAFIQSGMALAAFLLVWGCARNPEVAGGDDYPNSVSALGKHAAQERNDTSEWNAYRDAPSNPPGLYDRTAVPDSVSPTQTTTLTDTFTLSTDLLSGRVTLIHVHHVDSLRSTDTTVYQPGLAGLVKPIVVRVSGSTRYASGVEKRSLFEDGDGDGFLSPRQPGSGTALIRFTTILPSGKTQEKTVRITAGADLNFNTQTDNRLNALEQTDRNGSDTLSHLLLLDADGDGAIFDPAVSGNRVDAQEQTRDTIAGTKTTLSYRVAAFVDSTKNYPIRFHRIVESDGGKVETWALGRDSLPDFAAGDSGWVRTVYTPASTDSLSGSRSLYSVVLSDAPGAFDGNRLRFVDRTKTYRLGDVTQLHYRLQPDAAVTDGNFARIGALTVRLDFAGGKWIELQGASTTEEMTGLVTDSQGWQDTLHFDLQGVIKP